MIIVMFISHIHDYKHALHSVTYTHYALLTVYLNYCEVMKAKPYSDISRIKMKL